MSLEQVAFAARVRVGDTAAKFVLVRLADYASDGFVSATVVHLVAAEAEMTPFAVQRCIDLLASKSLLSVASRGYLLHGPWDDYGWTGRPFPEVDAPAVESSEAIRFNEPPPVLVRTGRPVKSRRKSKVSPRRRDRVYARDGYKCLACGAIDDLTLDHIQPQSRGGGHQETNLRTLCRSCNSRRGAGELPGLDTTEMPQ